MITSQTTFTAAPALNIAPNPKGLAKRFLAWLIAKDQAYQDRCYLETLTNGELRDVGLTRSDIS